MRIAAEVTFRFAIFSSGEYHSRVAPTANHQPTEHIIRVGPSSRLLDFDTLLYCIKGGLIDQRFMCVLYDNRFFRRTLYEAHLIYGCLRPTVRMLDTLIGNILALGVHQICRSP